jgi:sugar phosphate isomerase/epimerase
MRIQEQPPLHLAYCLNIHRGETWAENFAAIRDLTTKVRNAVAPDLAFGLGMRLGAVAARELSDPHKLGDFKAFLAEMGLYVFTMNGFPYGPFHGEAVKEKVYQPDWRTTERRDYMIQLAEIMMELAPVSVGASISTVPVSFKGWIQSEADRELTVLRLVEVVTHLERIHQRKRRDIHLGLEPEPACYLETTAETVEFFKHVWHTGSPALAARLSVPRAQAEEILRRRLGVCFDTCHVALQFEDLAASWDAYQAAGIRISKVQISAALACDAGAEGLAALQPFAEGTYLHQTIAQRRDRSLRRWTDLLQALAELPGETDIAEARCHFHVPLFWDGGDVLRSTRDQISNDFVKRLRTGGCEHLEIETYTFDVLPPLLRGHGVVESIAREYAWAVDRLGRRA